MQHNSLVARYARGNLVVQILVGIVFGILLATISPSHAESAGLIGSLFVGALKAIAPILVFILVADILCGSGSLMGCHIILLYRINP